MANQYDPQITKLSAQAAKVQSALERSPTAMSSGAAPTESDLMNETRKRSLDTQIQRLKNDKIKDQWYGTSDVKDETDGTGVQEGLIGRALHALASPLYGMVGGVEAVLGQGTKPGFENIAANIKERESFSNLLKKNKVPGLVAAPLGFALDVAFDPVNWSVVGAAATVPRTAIGLAKGGLKGAAAGAGSNLAATGAMLTGAATLGAKSNLRTKLATSAEKMSREFNQITGFDPEAALVKSGAGTGILGQGVSDYRIRLGDIIKNGMTSIPGGEKLFNSLNYDNLGYHRLLKLKDAVESRAAGVKPNTTAAQAGDILEELPISPQSLDELDSKMPSLTDVAADGQTFAVDKKVLANLPPSEMRDFLTSQLDAAADDVDFILKKPEAIGTVDPEEQLLRFDEEIAETANMKNMISELEQQFKMNGDETGIKWFDDAAQKVRQYKVGNFEAGKTAIDAYSSLIRWFKQAKTGLNPATGVANMLSAPALMMMYGKNFTPGMAKDFMDTYNFLGGRNSAKFLANSGMFDKGSEWIRFMADRPGTFTRTFGMSPKYAVGRSLVDRMMQTARDQGITASTNSAEMMAELDKVLRTASDDIQDIVGAPMKPGKTAAQNMDIASGAPVDRWENIMKGSKVEAAPTPSATARELAKDGDTIGGVSWSGSEFIDDNALARFSAKVAERSQTEGGWWSVMNTVLNKTMTAYEQIDQAWRLTIAKSLTKEGITEGELATMGRISEFNAGSVSRKSYDKNGKLRFHLSPDKATEIASDILFNYAAMPSAIRMLRNLPFFGAPFASFMYGSALRTAQALAYNPSSFNKITFALNSVSGEKSATERKALDSKYYEWYNRPSMVRLPFFDEYPLYLNTANVLPYYSMNMFEPAERRYADALPSAMVTAIDKSPILKDPVGQLLMDYIILPSIIRDAQPLNSFGQPLYPADSSLLEKAGYVGRSAADIVFPGGAAIAGLAAPEESAQFLPGYRTRQIANAKEGKSQLGIEGKEDPASRVMRALAGYGGLPLQRLDPSAARSEFE